MGCVAFFEGLRFFLGCVCVVEVQLESERGRAEKKTGWRTRLAYRHERAPLCCERPPDIKISSVAHRYLAPVLPN